MSKEYRGKILTDSKKLNIAIILMLVNAVLYMTIGFIYAISGTFMPYHVDFIGKTESDVRAYDAELMIVISALIRLLGFYLIALAIIAIFVTKFGIRERKKWAWYCYLIKYLVIIPPNLILTWMITGIFGSVFFLTAIIAISWLIAQYLSYKEIF